MIYTCLEFSIDVGRVIGTVMSLRLTMRCMRLCLIMDAGRKVSGRWRVDDHAVTSGKHWILVVRGKE
jgi:hypothetical protein